MKREYITFNKNCWRWNAWLVAGMLVAMVCGFVGVAMILGPSEGIVERDTTTGTLLVVLGLFYFFFGILATRKATKTTGDKR